MDSSINFYNNKYLLLNIGNKNCIYLHTYNKYTINPSFIPSPNTTIHPSGTSSQITTSDNDVWIVFGC